MILNKITAFKKREVAKNKKLFPLSNFKSRLKKSDRDFKKAVSENSLNLIAEIKKASPSEGIINKNFNFEKIAETYSKNQHVKAISVLTDVKFFAGRKTLIHAVKKFTEKPILRKDFIIDEYQIYESRFYGADALLLIAGILTKKQLEKFIKIAKRYDMDCLVEIHNKEEIAKLPNSTEIIGINNRNLDTLSINLETTNKLVKLINKKLKNKVIVSESGINSRADINKIQDKVNAVLIGTSLIKSKDINSKINSLFKPKIKICGITNLEDAKAASKLGADYLGFIFYKRSPRYIGEDKAKNIISQIKKSNKDIKFAGVFVNESIEKISKIKKYSNLDFIQFHGDETNDFIKKLNEKNIIKAFRVRNNQDIREINNSLAKYVLLDAYHKSLYGGTGSTFNWGIMPKIRNKKIFLSGGLNPDNIKKAVKLNTYAIDLSSGVEKSPGKKDHKKLKKLFKNLK